MELSALDPHQRKAVEHGDGPLLIISGPGSGKTRTLTHRIAWLLYNNVFPENILAVTFTNKAGKEMKTRIHNILQTDQIPKACTFHSWCVSVLRSNIHLLNQPFDNKFSIYDTDDQVKAYREVIKALGLDTKKYIPSEYQSRISYAKNQSLNPRGFLESLRYATPQDRDTVLAIYDDYHKLLEKNNALDFDDLLLKTIRLLRTDEATLNYYHERYKHILVDEYQDTNEPQVTLVKLLTYGHFDPKTFDWTGRSLTGVGDDGQGIYSFRGSKPQNMMAFEKVFPGTQTVRLEENYRSTKHITALANQLIAHNEAQIPKNLFSKRDGHIVNALKFPTNHEEASWVACRIEQHLKHFPGQKIFIIYRTNAMSRSFEMALRRLGIPHQLVGGLSFYERREVKDIVAYLRVIHNPHDSIACKRIINVPSRGIGDTTLERLSTISEDEEISLWDVCEMAEAISRHVKISAKALTGIEGFRDLITSLKKEQPIQTLLRELLSRSGYETMLSEDEEDEERLENIGELLNAAAEADAEGLDLGGFLDRASLQSDTDKMEEEAPVSLITGHSVKGLEAHTCFLVGWEEGILPHAKSMETQAEIEEERRVAYVALTRAEEFAYITFCNSRNLYGNSYDMKPSRFLADIENPESLKMHVKTI